MRILKKVSLIMAAMSVILVVGGCASEPEEMDIASNFIVNYEAEKTVDKIVIKVGEVESEVTPMHEDKKVKKGYRSNLVLPEEELNFSLEVIDEGNVIYSIKDSKVDLTDGKKVDVNIIDGKDGDVEVKVVSKEG